MMSSTPVATYELSMIIATVVMLIAIVVILVATMVKNGI
jgi:hypothetical protein